jgi:hypothetical protein
MAHIHIIAGNERGLAGNERGLSREREGSVCRWQTPLGQARSPGRPRRPEGQWWWQLALVIGHADDNEILVVCNIRVFYSCGLFWLPFVVSTRVFFFSFPFSCSEQPFSVR